ncbi:uncharacterized protein LOC126373432 [Pectinophora gossypiella]|uniref:uncharacterized protein LOC126373432 n=1 Tax=Pectinophora gossypiella TaxID=13191 RepID=UPI00214EDCBB|nr:uncharacterized protein LOC126373432 [Pectinophora gossypiella]
MCKEGGCGACIVSVTTTDKHGHPITYSVNSCLVSVTSCHNWKVTTIEGIGDRRKGYHPLQKTLAEYNGTQCGHCSPGWIMNMFGLLESKHYDLTQYEIENSFGSNTCRCTGFRPILDAFKSFAKDAPKPNAYIDDIEDLTPCKNKNQCNKTCDKEWCFIDKSDVDNVLKIKLKDDHIWYRVTEIHHIFNILEEEGTDSYMLVNGNTGRGAVPIFSFPRVLIDVKPVEELTEHFIDQNLVVGAGMTLTDLMELFKKVSKEHEEFAYLEKLYEHLDLVAHIPVRNVMGSEVDADVSLNDYLRNFLNLRGTKFMCKEGGCGACIVSVTADSNGHKRTFSVNSCLVSVTSCHHWEVTTIEGIGDRRKGYHPIQKTLAEYDGTQCGYCSPGWVMSMYSLLESNGYDLTQYQVENSFGSNTCRCTGFRPILDAFKSFAKDAPKPNPYLADIEDLAHCKNKGKCNEQCEKDWCFVQKSEVDNNILKIVLKDNRVWYRVTQLNDIFTILDKEGTESYMLVNGNTGKGAIPILAIPRVLIDVSPVEELKGHYVDQNLVVGAGTTLTDLMELFKTISWEREEFSYLQKLYEHLDLVAHIPVRNVLGSEVDADVSLNDYLRNFLNLRGTKFMCKEGGCGACIVSVTTTDSNGHKITFSVNSCLVSVTSCHYWEVTTIEGIGDRRKGYHPIQKTLAEYDGTQCGYCSPGWVMSMYSLLESNGYDLTQYQVENSFGSNTCRCTGFRPILDAFKSFAKDAPKPNPHLADIEDLAHCKNKGKCNKKCEKDWCFVQKSDVDNNILKIVLKDNRVWYRVTQLNDIFTILAKEGTESYMLVNGNTGKGAIPILAIPRVLIDVSPVEELKGHYVDQNLVVGAGTTLTDLMELFKTISWEREEFSYLQKLYEHLDLVAHIPVRNVLGSEVDADVSLNDYLRNFLNLRGTKYMCKEGGCGACIVSVTTTDSNGHERTFSVNSCLVSVTSCHHWEVTTIEGIGDRRKGYHPIQKTLAEYDGTQCGYCSPGWVMSMYSLLESNNYDVTQSKIENSFGSNTCRCTGYRPILDAFKSFAKDAPKPNPPVADIEDLTLCKNKGDCNKKCEKDWCFVQKSDVDDKILKIVLNDYRVWYRVKQLSDIFTIFKNEGTESYMLVNGNTGKGAIPILAIPRVLIDVSPVEELKGHYVDQNLVVGAGTNLTDLMELFKTISWEREEFSYLQKLYEHLDLVAHIPVRNIGTVAGNLMLKHRLPTFSSDIFLLLESIMPRAQNAHAQVNGAFLYQFRANDDIISTARIVITGLSGKFVHAKNTEEFLVHKNIFTNEVLQAALKILDKELIVEEIPGDLSPEYRRKCALGLFYKSLLTLIPKEKLNHRYLSGARDLRKTRPVSHGTEVYDTNPAIWPITEPMPKVEALIQTSGEAKYINDLPTQPNEVFCAFVTSDICTGEILEIDPTPALKIPGVLAFFSAKDIPGVNSFTFPVKVVGSGIVLEEIFADGIVKYYDQPIGIIVAETEKMANRAALLVRIKYKKDKDVPILTIDEVKAKDPSRITVFLTYPARDRGVNVQKVIKGSDNIFQQYHYTMETLTCVARPSDFGLDVFASTQWPDLTQVGISTVLNVEQNRINLEVFRCGGSYGNRISRASHIAAACSLASYLTNRPCRFVMSIQSNIRCDGTTLDITQPQILPPIHMFEHQVRFYILIYLLYKQINTVILNHLGGSFEAVVMTEQIMEHIAYSLNLDPIKVRLQNLDPQRTEITEMVETLIKDSNYNKRKEEVEKFNKLNRWKKRGLRVAFMSWPVAAIVDYPVLLTVHHGDATVTVCHAGVEFGQGINTKVIQAVAYTLNISISKVKVKSTDCVTTPNPFITGGSRTTEAVCFGAIKCCQLLLDRLSVVREELNNATWEELIEAAHNRGIGLQTNYRTTANDQMTYRVGGVAFAEVELDVLTGEHDVLRVDLIDDVGLSLNPELDIGQIEGAFTMGLGFWTCEHFIFDKKTGEILTDRTWNYHVPLAKDIPIDFRVQLRRNSYNPIGTLGAKGITEPPICLSVSVAFALREAIASSREESGYPRTEWFNVGKHL